MARHPVRNAGQHGKIGAGVVETDKAGHPSVERAHKTAVRVRRCSETALPQIHEQRIGLIGLAFFLSVLFGCSRLGGGCLRSRKSGFCLLALCLITGIAFQTAVDSLHQLVHLVFGGITGAIELDALLLQLAAVAFALTQLVGQDLVVRIALVEKLAGFPCGAVEACVECSGTVGIQSEPGKVPVGFALAFLQVRQGAGRTLDPLAQLGFFTAQIGK